MLSRFWTWLFRSQTLQFLLIVLLIVLAAVFVAVLVSKSLEACVLESLGLEEDAKYEALKFLGISMGGVLIALQALMSYKRAKAMEKTAQSQADAVLKTEQGQRQDRLKNAIEHLGHKSDSVRLGGAYELFHLAQDTPDTPELRQTVHDILCAHIRQTTGEKEYQEKHESNPSEEVQSLLNLLFVQEPDVFKGLSADLQGSWLKGVALERARLENATLVGVQLQRADLRVVQLQGADLSEAKMQEATLQGVQLQGADLSEAKMQEATL
ncbi:MAG: pentapeptide repeat-containing protein, partial [Gemmatimonadetes bacterium]|nr:pentapeptide repeat-containing protein [Gemmatimonadota bacterium]